MRIRSARAWLAIVIVATLVSGCSSEPTDPAPRTTSPADDPESWTMSPDSFGPVTTDMTRAEILKTGAYRVSRGTCGSYQLDWYTQKYERSGSYVHSGQTKPLYIKVGPSLPGIMLDRDGTGKPQYIDGGRRTKTDTGVGEGDTIKELEAAYGERLIPEARPIWGPTEQHFAVSGKRSHLVIDVHHGKIAGFYLTPGKVTESWSGADVRGVAC